MITINGLTSTVLDSLRSWSDYTNEESNLQVANLVTSALQSYLQTNASAKVTFVSDMVTIIDTVPIAVQLKPFTASSFDAWVNALETTIIQGLMVIGTGPLGVIVPTPSICLTPTLQLSQETIRTAYLSSSEENAADSCWKIISMALADWLQGPHFLPYPATYLGITGTITETTIK